MTHLIVDFPSSRRRSIMRSSNKPKNNESKKSSGVSFAKSMHVKFFQAPDDVDESEIWYTSEEYKDMKESNRQVIIRVHRKLRTSSLSTDDDGIDYKATTLLEAECLTGIEHLLSVKIIEKTRANRVECSNSVLQVQDRLWYHNVGSMEESDDPIDALARVSKHYSRWSTKRARIIGQYNA